MQRLLGISLFQKQFESENNFFQSMVLMHEWRKLLKTVYKSRLKGGQ